MTVTIENIDGFMLCKFCKMYQICSLKDDYKEIVRDFFISCARQGKQFPNDYFATPECLFYADKQEVYCRND